MPWSTGNIPDLSGKTAIVTGANTGIGYETALALARKKARVVLACRSRERGERALLSIREAHPGASAGLILVDLGSLLSVRSFAAEFRSKHDRLDLLINNAGVMIPPFARTEGGLEVQIGVNHFGHFALTGLLNHLLAASPGSRVVVVSSLAHRQGRIDFENLQGERPYKPWREYGQSKLANLVFAIELQRRLERAGQETVAIAAHPGFTETDLQRHSRLLGFGVKLWSNNAAQGALPTLYAATEEAAEPGGYYGPHGFYEAKGFPAPARVKAKARDRRTAARLWEVSEEVTGVRFLSSE